MPRDGVDIRHLDALLGRGWSEGHSAGDGDCRSAHWLYISNVQHGRGMGKWHAGSQRRDERGGERDAVRIELVAGSDIRNGEG